MCRERQCGGMGTAAAVSTTTPTGYDHKPEPRATQPACSPHGAHQISTPSHGRTGAVDQPERSTYGRWRRGQDEARRRPWPDAGERV